MAISTTFLLLASLLLFLHASQGCDPENYQPATLEYKMRDSDVVVSGTVLNQYGKTQYHDGIRYNVNFNVKCIYKGAPLPREITVEDVGVRQGLCFSTNMTTGADFIIYLHKREDGSFVPEFSQDPGGDQYLEELVILCETKIDYPIGLSEETADKKCPKAWDHGSDCVAIPTEAPTPLPNEKSPPPPPEGEGGDKPPYKPVVNADDPDNGNSGIALTFSLSTVFLLVLSAILL